MWFDDLLKWDLVNFADQIIHIVKLETVFRGFKCNLVSIDKLAK